MASSAFYAPAHRIIGRVPPGSGLGAPIDAAPSADAPFSGLQDPRWPWNTGGSVTTPEVVMFGEWSWPLIDWTPSPAAFASIAPPQVPVSGQPLQLVTVSGGGVVVVGTPVLMFSSGQPAPANTVFMENNPQYRVYGSGSRKRVFVYTRTTMLGRGISLTSTGNDSGAQAAISGVDIYGFPMVEQFPMGNAATVYGGKAFKGVFDVTCTGTLSGFQVYAGHTDVFGLPFWNSADRFHYRGYWGTTDIFGAGTQYGGTPRNVPSTRFSSDVRGYWIPPTPSDGNTNLVFWLWPSQGDLAPPPQGYGIIQGLFGMPQAV